MNKVKVNGYEFEVDERTGTMIASGALSVGKTAPRTHRAAKAGGSRHEESDHDGHGIAARFNGPTIEENLSAMNGKINQGSYKRMENAEVALLKTGASVQTERIAYAYSPKAEDGGVRPEAYLVNDTVTPGTLLGKPDVAGLGQKILYQQCILRANLPQKIRTVL